ncbi:MAG TPA: type I restriction enzyme endonuclease domain-containing protein [Acidiferrobacter sp.]|nr:type I restriction enzyme endonuclease domain-containing protein [Acidiferrobacter sp.]
MIEGLIRLAKDRQAVDACGKQQHIDGDALASCDVLETNDRVVKVFDAYVCAQLRALRKRILYKYGYPQNAQEWATQTVLRQADLLPGGWVWPRL